MKLNEKALKQSMENAKKNFNKACDNVVDFAKKLNKSMEAFKEEFNKYGEKERPCCGGHCHCNHDADGDHACQCHQEVEPEFNLENKDNE